MIAINSLRPTTRKGLALATLILLGWLISMTSLLIISVTSWPWWWTAMAVLLRTFLHTGLFITAHDAMHGVLLPELRSWNQRLGAVCLSLYAALPYRVCLRNHHLHHSRPATAEDPDFHGDPTAGLWRWYGQFMVGYLSPRQMGRLLGFWGLLILILSPLNPGTWMNLLLFYTLPLLLSSLQLFVFGTYLPHRGQRLSGRQGRPISLEHPPWLSLLTCFHFGYHSEHHDHPQLAWFELPDQRRRIQPLTASLTTRVASQRA